MAEEPRLMNKKIKWWESEKSGDFKNNRNRHFIDNVRRYRKCQYE